MRFSTACTTVGGESPESFRTLATTVEFANLNVKFLNFVVAGGARRRVTVLFTDGCTVYEQTAWQDWFSLTIIYLGLMLETSSCLLWWVFVIPRCYHDSADLKISLACSLCLLWGRKILKSFRRLPLGCYSFQKMSLWPHNRATFVSLLYAMLLRDSL